MAADVAIVPIAIVMGSQSDWATMKCAADALAQLGVAHDARIVSAHRTPDRLFAFAKGAADEGFKVIIAGAGGAAHLPGMVASLTHLPALSFFTTTSSSTTSTSFVFDISFCKTSFLSRTDGAKHFVLPKERDKVKAYFG